MLSVFGGEKVPEENLNHAMMERFPFLARYVRHPSVWGVYLKPADVDLARKYPEVRGSWRCPCQIRIVLLDSNGDEIGFIGERPKVIPAAKFLWWTVSPEETTVEQFHETVQQAIQRFHEPVRWVLNISERAMAGGYNATLFFPPDGQSMNDCLTRLLEQEEQEKNARMEEYDRRRRQQEADTLAAQRRLLKEKLPS